MFSEKTSAFRTVSINKREVIGSGYYGTVYTAKCDDFLCAVKVFHLAAFHFRYQVVTKHEGGHCSLPLKQFEQECDFMNTIHHPNIIQYLGTSRDPATNLPVLLMELMEESLTRFLERFRTPIPFHTQVNICHDIALALSFLHSNGIIHRDLSSNNVLMIGGHQAKVTDFGMARLININSSQLRMCQGVEAYMPPEATHKSAQYSDKIDSFSFGVIIVQIGTRLFPKPVTKSLHSTSLSLHTSEVHTSEVEKRHNHISLLDSSDPLLLIALPCLSDNDYQRPTAKDISHSLKELKETALYVESRANGEGSCGIAGDVT